MMLNYKKLFSLWSLFVTVSLILISGFNYIIDPYAHNNKFTNKFNIIKLLDDDISLKFIFSKSKEFNTFTLGSSRGSVIDPELIKNNLKNSRPINASFGSASLDEIKIYIDSIILNGNDFKYVFIGLDLFQFSENWRPTRSAYAMKLMGLDEVDKNYIQYISLNTTLDSIKTVKYNSSIGSNSKDGNCDKKCMSYLKKGMRYYDSVINNKNYDIQKKVTSQKFYWHRESYDYSQVLALKDILSKLKENNVTAFIYMNPIPFQQMYSSEISGVLSNGASVDISRLGTSFFEQLNLIDDIVSNTGAVIYDFNNLNTVNLNNSYFIDPFHFNYMVADCIINKMTIDKSECGNDFGEKINENNIKEYKHQTRDKYFKLLVDGKLGFGAKKTENAIKLTRELMRKYQ